MSVLLSETLLWLFPAVFVLHEAEEVLFLPSWLQRHREWLLHCFPRGFSRLLPFFDGISRTTFAGIAAEEFVLVLGVTALAAWADVCYPWLALFLAFGVHLVVHLLQGLLIRRYVPVVATSLIGLLYCGWGLRTLLQLGMFSLREYVLCAVAGCLIAGANLLAMHALAATLRRRPRN